jgi:hypothetical protein
MSDKTEEKTMRLASIEMTGKNAKKIIRNVYDLKSFKKDIILICKSVRQDSLPTLPRLQNEPRDFDHTMYIRTAFN